MAYTETTSATSSSPELVAAAALAKAASRNISGSPSPSGSSASAAQPQPTVAPKDGDIHDDQQQQQAAPPASSSHRMSPTFIRHSPDQGSSNSQPTTGFSSYHDSHYRPIQSSSSSSYQPPPQPPQQQHHYYQGSQWHVRDRDSGYVDSHERYRASSVLPGQSSPPARPSRSSPSEYPPHSRVYSGPPQHTMPHSPLDPPPRSYHSPDSSYQSNTMATSRPYHRRGYSDSDGGDGYMDRKFYRYPHHSVASNGQSLGREQEAYPADPSHYISMSSNSGKPQNYDDITRDHRAVSAYPPHENLPPLAPRSRYSPEDEVVSASGQHHYSHQQHLPHLHQQQHHSYHHQQQQQHFPPQQQLSGSSIVKKEANPPTGPFRIQSARGTPKGPLPIDVQISLLTSVLQHDPFNCAIRKTTQAWESISREQGIRARTCSRRFDNIIQASIAGRDRPIGTEEQQATKKRLLEQLFEMMNQPQALKRMQKKRRYRSEDTDRQLLLETIRLNPFAQKVGQVAKAWEDVRDALKMKVHARQCIRRVNRMVKPYQLRERMYKGNIPEDMREANDDLVKQIIQLMRQAGQGGNLDEACNSHDEDSASYMSDSEDQDEYMDGQRENAQGEDEEDEDMQSRSESEQRSSGQKKDDDTTPRSPITSADPTPSTQPTTPSLSAPVSGTSSSTPATPAKRGRPRNPVPATATSAQNKRQSSHSSIDRTRNTSSADVNMTEATQQHQQDSNTPRHRPSWEGEHSDSKLPRPSNNNVDSQSTPLSSPLPVHSPSRQTSSAPAPPHISSHARQYSQGEFGGTGDYKRPIKHARTSSRGGYEIPLERAPPNDRFTSFPPSHHPVNSGRGGPAMDSHGRPIVTSGPPSGPHEANMDSYSMRGQATVESTGPEHLSNSSLSIQQYREILNEMHAMRDYLAQMDEHRKVDMEKQGAMMYTIEKMQHQLQQQQQQLSQLQHQLRYGSQQQQPQQPPQQEHSPHHRSQPPPSSAASGGPSQLSNRYSHSDDQQHLTHHHHQHPPQQQHGYHRGGPMDGGCSMERPGSEMSHHSSYSMRPDDGHFLTHDRELR
ncbi:hypothetical protein FBU30_002045 [Linnemannia zychae]|nr:hypothetical protein FBU30_002045 [Linnemannia zychae]